MTRRMGDTSRVNRISETKNVRPDSGFPHFRQNRPEAGHPLRNRRRTYLNDLTAAASSSFTSKTV